MREVLPIIWLMEEAKQKGVPVLNATPKVHCKVFYFLQWKEQHQLHHLQQNWCHLQGYLYQE